MIEQVVSASGIPSAALSAYERAAQVIDAADTTCNVPWELIAAIGRVESNHGQYAGNSLDDQGVAVPGIFGPTLNGKNGTQAIMDTDGGQLDQDPVYDRAVGPMQFIPSIWSSVKVDADGDGQRNPQDIDDAALASGVYLCSGNDDLSTRAGQEASVFRYNHSRAYVDLVLRIMEAYSHGEYTAIPSGTYGGTILLPAPASAGKSHAAAHDAQPTKAASTLAGTTGPGSVTGTKDDHSAPSATRPSAPAAALTQSVTDTVSGVQQATAFCQATLTTQQLNLLGGLTACVREYLTDGVDGLESLLGGLGLTLTGLLPHL